MGSALAIYFRLVGARIRSQFQYRTSFFLQLLGTTLVGFLDLVTILVLFLHIPHLGGWTLPEVAFLFGTSYMSFRITEIVIGHVERIDEHIRTGRFDGILIRPLGSLFQMATEDFALRWMGGLLQGLIVFAWAVANLQIAWGPGKVVMTGVMVVSGAALFAGVWVAANSIAFWFVDSREVANAFVYGGDEVTSYPFHIFGKWLRRIFLYVFPLSFVSYFPALYILDKPVPFGLPAGTKFASPVVAVVVVWVAGRVWSFAVRHYRSTGS